MRILLAVISVITGLLITACSSGSSEITFTPLFQCEEITVPGVQKECKSEYRERAEQIIKDFYTNGELAPFDGNWVLGGETRNCFNDSILTDYAYENSPEAQALKEKEAKEWVPDGYNISYQGTQVIDGFAQKFLKSGYQCASGSEGCFGVSVIARDGCPSGIYAYMFYTDSSGQLPEVMETTGRAQAMQKMTLVFNFYDSDVKSGRIWKVGCN
jgi:hypothetical protein